MLKFMLTKAVPTRALEKWECSDQLSFDLRLQESLNHIASLLGDEELSPARLDKIAEEAEMIRDLMYLYRRVGLQRQRLPFVLPRVLEDRDPSV